MIMKKAKSHLFLSRGGVCYGVPTTWLLSFCHSVSLIQLRSSISSRESSLESLEVSSGSASVRKPATSVGGGGGGFRRGPGRKSRSILQKAKIWESLDEKSEHAQHVDGGGGHGHGQQFDNNQSFRCGNLKYLIISCIHWHFNIKFPFQHTPLVDQVPASRNFNEAAAQTESPHRRQSLFRVVVIR